MAIYFFTRARVRIPYCPNLKIYKNETTKNLFDENCSRPLLPENLRRNVDPYAAFWALF